MYKNVPLMREVPGVFSPLYVNGSILEGNTVAALYRFSTIFFQNLSPSILYLLLNMEKGSHRVITAINPTERESLIKELEGVSVEVRYMVKDNGETMLTLPINISPAEVLKNAHCIDQGPRGNAKIQKDLNKILICFIRKKIQHKIKIFTKGFLTTCLGKLKKV